MQDSTALAVLPDSVPCELTALPQWVCWALEPRSNGEQPTKIPYCPTTLRRAKANDPRTWGTFDAALSTYISNPQRWAGVGFEFAGDGGVVGVDLDTCRDKATGEVAPWAIEIVERFATYTEVSPSGTGVKLWCEGTVPGDGSGKRKPYATGAVELYGRARFFAVTGHRLQSAPATINEGQEAIDWLWRTVFSESEKLSALQSVRRGTERDGEAQSKPSVRRVQSGTEYPAPSLRSTSAYSVLSVGQGAGENLRAKIEAAIRATQPTRLGERRRCLFHFARHVKALPALADAPLSALRPYVRRWHEMAVPIIGTKPFDDTWFDFTKALAGVKYPAGTEPIAMLLALADAAEPPDVALEYDHPALRRLVALCCELQRAAGDAPFYLSARTGERLLSIHYTTVSAWLGGLCRDGVLRLVERGSQAGRRASRYRYLGRL